MLCAEGERLGAQEHLLDLGQPRLVAGERRIARRARRAALDRGQGEPADAGEHARDVGVRRDGHPRVVPDQIEHGARRPARRLGQRQLMLQRGAQRRRPLGNAGHGAELGRQLGDERQVVFRADRVGYDDARRRSAPSSNRLDRLAPVLVNIDQHVRRRQPAQLVEIDRLGAAHLRHPAHGSGRMDAPAGTRHQMVAQTERHDELGQARHQAGNPHRRRLFEAHRRLIPKSNKCVPTF